MPRSLAALVFPLLVASVGGCCGGYSVVRTTIASRAALDERAGEAAEMSAEPTLTPDAVGERATPPPSRPKGEAYVLHYSRLGEPANACGSGLQYVEDLFIRVPSIAVGSAFKIGEGGVVALYSRRQEGPPSGAKKVAGTVTVLKRSGGEVEADIEVTIELPSGETVELDDEYTFHPNE